MKNILRTPRRLNRTSIPTSRDDTEVPDDLDLDGLDLPDDLHAPSNNLDGDAPGSVVPEGDHGSGFVVGPPSTTLGPPPPSHASARPEPEDVAGPWISRHLFTNPLPQFVSRMPASRVPATAKLVYAVLLRFALMTKGVAYPSYGTIAVEIGTTRRHAQEMVARLVSAKLIRVETQHEGTGRQTSNVFHFLNAPELRAAVRKKKDEAR